MDKIKAKIYSAAPLPFQGQKRNFISQFRAILEDLKKKRQIDFIVDLFGGSGLLSRAAKDVFPGAEVVYNDYDDYHKRLLNVGRTNRLLDDLRGLLVDRPKHARIEEPYRGCVVERIKRENEAGYVDCITLSSSLLFSSRWALSCKALMKGPFYNRIRTEGYKIDVGHYLRGLKIVKEDYTTLFGAYRGKGNVLFLIDPPCLSTDRTTYQNNKYWSLRDYLEILNILNTENYFYFTSDKSQLLEFCEWLESSRAVMNPLKGSMLRTHKVRGNTVDYVDLMLYRFKDAES